MLINILFDTRHDRGELIAEFAGLVAKAAHTGSLAGMTGEGPAASKQEGADADIYKEVYAENFGPGPHEGTNVPRPTGKLNELSAGYVEAAQKGMPEEMQVRTDVAAPPARAIRDVIPSEFRTTRKMPKPDFAAVMDAAKKLVDSDHGGLAEVKRILSGKYNVKTVRDLKPDQYVEFQTLVEDALRGK